MLVNETESPYQRSDIQRRSSGKQEFFREKGEKSHEAFEMLFSEYLVSLSVAETCWTLSISCLNPCFQWKSRAFVDTKRSSWRDRRMQSISSALLTIERFPEYSLQRELQKQLFNLFPFSAMKCHPFVIFRFGLLWCSLDLRGEATLTDKECSVLLRMYFNSFLVVTSVRYYLRCLNIHWVLRKEWLMIPEELLVCRTLTQKWVHTKATWGNKIDHSIDDSRLRSI